MGSIGKRLGHFLPLGLCLLSSIQLARASKASCVANELSEALLAHPNDEALFANEVSRFRSSILRGGRVEDLAVSAQTPLDRLALLEAILNFDRESDVHLDAIFKEGTVHQKKRLAALLLKLDFSAGLSPQKAARIASRLIRIAHGNPLSLDSIKPSAWEKSYQGLLRERFEAPVLAEGIEAVLRRDGSLRANTPLQSLARWRNLHDRWVEAILALAADSGWFAETVQGAPLVAPYLPRIRTLAWRKLPPELLERLRTEGFDRVYPDIVRQFPISVRTDFFYAWFRRAYLSAAGVLAGYVGYDTFQEKKLEEQKRMNLELERLHDLANQQPNREALIDEIIQMSEKNLGDTLGRPLSEEEEKNIAKLVRARFAREN